MKSLTLFLSACALCAGAWADPVVKTVKEDVWHGFKRTHLEVDGRAAWVVEPSGAPKEGMPWTWTIQWSEHFVNRTGVLPLLKAGFHHVFIDVYDTKMDERGLKACADFQDYLVKKRGFAPKTRLIGMSWGGFFSIRYAATYPQNVDRIYLDAPVLDFAHMPELTGVPKEDAEAIGPWYARKPKTGWLTDPEMPINMADRLVKAKIPLFLIYGGQDQCCDPKGAKIFIERVQKAGGTIKVDCRPGYGHHPHGLDPDSLDPLVDFLGR
jgi:pimeloyl-ACP methyl ester carboxylesterase